MPAHNPSAIAVSQLTRASPSTRLQPSTWTSRYAPQQPHLLRPWTALKLPLLSCLEVVRRPVVGLQITSGRTAAGASERSMDAEEGVAGAHTCWSTSTAEAVLRERSLSVARRRRRTGCGPALGAGCRTGGGGTDCLRCGERALTSLETSVGAREEELSPESV